jgi:hypothetical protein
LISHTLRIGKPGPKDQILAVPPRPAHQPCSVWSTMVAVSRFPSLK